MSDNQRNYEDKLREFPIHKISKEKQDHMHHHVMDALKDEIVPEKRSRLWMKRIQVGIASVATLTLITILSISLVTNNQDKTGDIDQPVTPTNPTNEEVTENPEPLEEQVPIEQQATEIYQALQNRDMELLSTYVHAQKGLSLSLYGYSEQYSHVFEKDQVKTLLQDNTEYVWGIGEANMEIKLSPNAYFDRYLKTDTFLNKENEVYDSESQRTSITEKLQATYPNSKIVEFYNEGTDQYSKLDWKSVYLMFEQNEQSIWELVAVISNEWTP